MTAPQHDLSRLTINRDAPPPALRRALMRSLLLAGAAVVLIGAVTLAMRERGVPLVVVAVATAGGPGGSAGGSASVTANGYVEPRVTAAVSVKIVGRLEYLGVAEGSFVRQNEVIGRLESADYRAAVAQAEAQVALARANVIEAEADRDQVRREADRQRTVRAQNPNLVSQQDLDLAESRAAQADARVQAAVARKEAADAGLRLAQANLANTLILAPFTGTVLRKEAEVGEVMAPSVGGGLTRGAVVTMADLSTLEVEVDVNEAYIARIRGGQQARITLDAYPDTTFRGRVRQVIPTADRQRATVQVKVSILDRDARILPEMGARVDFLAPDTARAGTAAAAPILRVPAAAVRDEAGEAVVWLVREGRLQRRAVSAGPVSGGMREVRSGLAGGEQLLVGGVDVPREGMRVRTP